jgi:hypothetical protein
LIDGGFGALSYNLDGKTIVALLHRKDSGEWEQIDQIELAEETDHQKLLRASFAGKLSDPELLVVAQDNRHLNLPPIVVFHLGIKGVDQGAKARWIPSPKIERRAVRPSPASNVVELKAPTFCAEPFNQPTATERFTLRKSSTSPDQWECLTELIVKSDQTTASLWSMTATDAASFGPIYVLDVMFEDPYVVVAYKYWGTTRADLLLKLDAKTYRRLDTRILKRDTPEKCVLRGNLIGGLANKTLSLGTVEAFHRAELPSTVGLYELPTTKSNDAAKVRWDEDPTARE